MTTRKRHEEALVWSSDGSLPTQGGSSCPSPRGGDGVVRVSRETKGRKGEGVTVITGVPLGGDDLKDLAKSLKQRCGSGGTVKDGVIEIQGDHRDTVVADFTKRGWVVKKSGG